MFWLVVKRLINSYKTPKHMLRTAVCLCAPANISHLSRHSVCVRVHARVMITFIDFVFSGIPSYTSRTHIWSWWLFSDPDFCLCFLVKVFLHGCQMLIFLVSCGSSCLCLSLYISLSTSVYLSLRMCVPECPTGFFRDDKKRCKKCSPLCESCMGSRSDQCSACRPGLYLMEGGNNCVSSCPDGFYLDLGKSHFISLQKTSHAVEFETSCGFSFAESTMCRKCRENCKKCMSANICTECQTGLR